MRRAARWVRIGVVCAGISLAGIAAAHSGGMRGKSGKQGSICNQCHQGGKTPSVTLVGPTELDAGTLATYTFQIETDAAITGMNAATTDGVLAGNPEGGATKNSGDEITHARTVRPDAGIVLYTFSMTAPEFGGKVTLFAAGNAADNNGQTDGDEAAGTQIDIEVSGPPRPPEPEAGPPPPPPAPPVDASTPSVDASTKPEAAPTEDGGCAVGSADRSSLPAGALVGALVGLAALLRTRRR